MPRGVSDTSKMNVARAKQQPAAPSIASTAKYLSQCAQDSRVVEFKVDSGAAVSVGPIELFKEYKLYPTYESENKIPYTVANGQKVYEVGVRWPVFREVTTGKLLRLPVRAADVRSNLLAPFDLAKLGIRRCWMTRSHICWTKAHNSRSIWTGKVARQ